MSFHNASLYWGMPKICKHCNVAFHSSAIINGQRKSLTGRSYCLSCSPFGVLKGYELRRGSRFTDEQLITAVAKSSSIAQVLRSLNCRAAGGNYLTIKSHIERLGLNTDHFTGQGYLKGKTHNWSSSIPLTEIMVAGSSYTSTHSLKRRLLKANIFEHKCYRCDNKEWQGHPIPLELEHINGDRRDNRKQNLTLLCPNCHALTDTYRGKNIKLRKTSVASELQHLTKPVQQTTRQKIADHKSSDNQCLDCGRSIYHRSKRCKSCAGKAKSLTRITWPLTTELIRMVAESSYVAVAKKLGVSDNAIRKRIKHHPIKEEQCPKPNPIDNARCTNNAITASQPPLATSQLNSQWKEAS